LVALSQAVLPETLEENCPILIPKLPIKSILLKIGPPNPILKSLIHLNIIFEPCKYRCYLIDIGK
jgi:hypothetical protein